MFCQFSGILLIAILGTGYVFAQDTTPKGPTQPDIAKNCNSWHTVGAGDTCWSIETKYKISHEKFLEWNPSVSSDCLTNFWASYSYCVGIGAQQSTPSSTSSITSRSSSSSSSKVGETSSHMTTSPITSTLNTTYSVRVPMKSWNITTPTMDTAFPPKRTQPGQPAYCRNWYYVTAGDTCENIVASSSWVSMKEFLEWNPTIKSDCSGLYVGWWVCIGIQPQTVTETFEYTITPPPLSVPPSPTKYTPTTFPPINSSFTYTPTLPDLSTDCEGFHQATAGDTCRSVLMLFNFISQEQFFKWNPGLKGNCDGLWEGYWYCIAVKGFTPIFPRVTAKPSIVPAGQPGTCNAWYLTTDSETCNEISIMFGTFTEAAFIEWNPSVGSDCARIKRGAYYCVGIPGTPTTRTAPLPTYTVPTETPVQSGIAPSCNKLWLVSLSDTCESISKQRGISEQQFLAWNPAVGKTTCDNLVPDFYVCVGIEASSTISSLPITSDSTLTTAGPSPTESHTPSATSSGGVISTPAPVQVQSGDGCWDIANTAGIDLK
ncbi:LysM domain-containing protein [Microsporum canis CBS 113480]|uniref:LysM domain-containing protein n=1 Tax=Arthroderma otae (strain ATCC MYA-4605 / CBS 113480) TaxID=554155 RepID=C5FMR9_ARTOC|nr:LysM domain-containing protein [Microsporum canis CBS 113480]EEQ31172.1 LysM domain-containing protein [Microsporum canis CBS 113480]